MTSYSVEIVDRVLDTPILISGLVITPGPYSFAATGGPESASLRASGPIETIRMVRRWLGHRMYLNEHAEGRVWWGYVAEIELHTAGMIRKYSLLPMVNSVWAYYTDASGTEQVTSAEQDASLIAEYGEKEQVLLLNTADSAFATATCQHRLAEAAKILIGYEPIDPPLRDDQAFAVVRCLGDLQRLEWPYYAGLGAISIAVQDADGYTAGAELVSGVNRAAQSYTNTSSDPWAPLSFSVEVSRYDAASPTQQLIIEDITDSGNTPTGAIVETFTVDSEDISAVYPSRTSLQFTMSGANPLAPGAKRWLALRSSGAGNGFYAWIRAGDAYTGGAFADYAGASWLVSTTGYDMYFTLVGGWDIQTQLDAILDEGAAFFPSAGRTYENVGAFTLPVNRTSAQPALDALKELLRGGGANGRRLLVEIPAPGEIRIYEQPDVSGELWSIDAATGRIFDAQHQPIRPCTCPVAFWAMPQPSDVDDEAIFIERTTYDPASGRLRLETKTQLELYQPGTRER